MTSVREILREADPLRDDPGPGAAERDRIRRAVVTAASAVGTRTNAWFRAPLAILAVAAVVLIGILAVGSRSGTRGSATVYAAVRFEVRLAEERAAAGLRAAKVTGADRTVYLHADVVVSNDDIERSRVVTAGGPSQFNVAVQFTPAGAEKMRRATADHVGRPMAVLIDGEVVMAPVLRDPIGDAAVIYGSFTRVEAERIVSGMAVR